MVWKFVIPDPYSFISGGNIYNGHITNALSGLNETVEIRDPDSISFDKQHSSSIHIWDSLYLHEYDKVKSNTIPGRHILLLHHLESMYPGPESIFKEMELPVISKMDGCWVTSEYSRNYLIKRRVNKPIWVLPPIINESETNSNQKIDNGVIKIVIAANLIERKGILPFLQKLSLIKNLPTFSLSIIGSQEMDMDYAELCKQTVIKNSHLNQCIVFQQELPQSTLFKMYKEADLYISTSYFETFGMSIQESLYFSTPVLGLQKGNIPNLIGTNGWCMPNMDELVKCFVALIMDPQSLKSMKVNYTSWRPNWREAARYLIDQIKI